MRPRAASRLAWSVWTLDAVMLLASGTFSLLAGVPAEEIVFFILVPLLVLSMSTVGALVASRQPGNAIGWIFLGVASLWALSTFGTGFAEYALARGMAVSRLVEVSDWIGAWLFVAGIFIPVTFLLLLFPDGRPPTHRWRPVAWISVVCVLGVAVSTALRPGPMEDAVILRSNPFAVGSEGIWDVIGNVTWNGAMVGVLLSVAALIVRFRRSADDERQQMRTLAAGGVVVVLLFVASFVGFSEAGDDPAVNAVSQAVILLALLGVPVAAGVAILKYRLYDIDLVIRKTVVYGALAAFVTAVYLGIVVGIGAFVGSRENLLLSILATAVIAVAFQPARERARRLADRLVYGKRASPYEVLSEFSDRLAEAYSVEDVLPRMARVLAEGTGASVVRVWLRVGRELRPVASWPNDAPDTPPAEGLSGLPDRPFEVRHQGTPLGAISVAMPASDPMTPAQEKLVEDLASQAGLVLRNAALIADLRASRQRIVAAQDEERRRLERNIHDGAQQQLVALAVKLGLAERLVPRDPEKAAEMLAEAKTETGEALANLRDLARGIYPPLLADQGLGAALLSQARKSAVPVHVDPDGIGRYPQEVEAAVYFSVLEALQNVAKYAQAENATIRLAESNGDLAFEVVDDGVGFDPTSTGYGTGLQGIADRLAALNGSIEVESSAGNGTLIRGHVPAPSVSGSGP